MKEVICISEFYIPGDYILPEAVIQKFPKVNEICHVVLIVGTPARKFYVIEECPQVTFPTEGFEDISFLNREIKEALTAPVPKKKRKSLIYII